MGTFIKNMLEVAHVLILLVSATHANWENIFSNQQNLQDYLTQPFSNSQGEYSTLSITENGQRVTQENILDRENNLMINIVPAHNGYDTAKYVFDGDSDFMMSVMYVEKSCTIQKNPVGKDIESTFRAFARNHVAYRSGGANMAKPVHVVKKPYKIIKGYMLKLFEIPLKFQPHCPPDFVAYTSHLIETSEHLDIRVVQLVLLIGIVLIEVIPVAAFSSSSLSVLMKMVWKNKVACGIL